MGMHALVKTEQSYAATRDVSDHVFCTFWLQSTIDGLHFNFTGFSPGVHSCSQRCGILVCSSIYSFFVICIWIADAFLFSSHVKRIYSAWCNKLLMTQCKFRSSVLSFNKECLVRAKVVSIYSGNDFNRTCKQNQAVWSILRSIRLVVFRFWPWYFIFYL